ncbi:hypothetical protein JMJ56_30000 [Belnapia sp. T18]|uniref:Uncharacterized protein n=2 Tax=Belnapia arida TaxID=2804533 RepID=A0ABS1UBZ4_9PROT|nr:hypothetical protein [Belnapia arida]
MKTARARGLSRRAMLQVDTDADLSAVSLSDKRQTEMAPLVHVDEALLATLQDIFAGTGLMSDQRKVRAVITLRGQVDVAWQQTRDAFLEIGRALNEVDAVLDEAEQESLKRGFRKLFPFSETVASQFRVIARAVDAGHITKEVLPGSYGTAYQMALLNSEQRRLAAKEGLIRPTVSRNALIEFRKLHDGVVPRTARGPDPAKMRAELGRLERSEVKLTRALDSVRKRIREIRELLALKDED